MSPRSNANKKLDAVRFTGVGFVFIAQIGALAALGWWLDGRLGTSPWLLVAGAFAGMVGATFSLLRAAERWESARRRRAEEEEAE